MVLAIVFGLLLVLPTHGSFKRLSEARLSLAPAFLLGATVQFIGTPLLGASSINHAPLIAWFCGAAILIVACLANARIPGLLLAALGIALNALVISVNTGMPVYTGALAAVGVGSDYAIGLDTIYHTSHSGTRLLFMADVLPVPGPVPIRSVASLGDLILCTGVLASILWLSRPAEEVRNRT